MCQSALGRDSPLPLYLGSGSTVADCGIGCEDSYLYYLGNHKS